MKKIPHFLTLLISSLFLTSCAESPRVFNATDGVKNTLNVHIENGTIAANNGSPQTYQPVNFTIANGDCQQVTVNLTNNTNLPLKACFKGNILFLDAKKFGEAKSTRFYYSPLWQQGFTYPNITTNGQSHLMNVDIRIQLKA